MARTKKKALTSLLPATPCPPEMREQMQSIAERDGKSIAQVQREAYALFLSRNFSPAIVHSS